MSKHYLPLITFLILIALTVSSFAFYKSFQAPQKQTPITLVTPSRAKIVTPTPTQVLGAQSKIELAITSPLAEASVSSSLLLVAGQTATEAAVTINDKKLVADSLGNFRTSLRLTEGANLIVVQASSSGKSTTWQTVVTYGPSESHPLLNLINFERQSRNISPLTLDAGLSNLAEKHSRDMADRNFFSHLNPDGKNPSQRLTESGIVFQTTGENIAFAPNLETAHQNLMKSEEHRNNILNPVFEKIGIGDYTQNPNKIFFTEVFTN